MVASTTGARQWARACKRGRSGADLCPERHLNDVEADDSRQLEAILAAQAQQGHHQEVPESRTPHVG